MNHKRLPDFEMYDEIRFSVLPRYKQSELSGDEWRQSIVVHFMFKGEPIKTFTASDMRTALLLAGGWYLTDSFLSDRQLELEKAKCDQPNCLREDVTKVQIIRETADDGSWLETSEYLTPHYRQFCPDHITRGDCGREDADSNYTEIHRRRG